MPAIYISKYNRFVDGVIARINKMLGKSYDPVRVKLEALEYKSKKTKVKSTKKNSKKNPSKGSKKNKKRQQQQKRTKTGSKKKIEEPMTNKMGEMTVAREENRIKNEEDASRESSFVLISKTGPTVMEETKNATFELRAASTNKQKTKKKTTSSGGGQKKKKSEKFNSRATLFGLSTIRRNGDVTVNVLKDRTVLKSNFLLGPLTLRVERETGKGARREVKSATATTAEMFGRLNMKIMHGGSATLQTIRVLQPKSVRVDSQDDHDKTREYVWKRSGNIASMVSRKLATVVKSLFKQ